MRVMRVSTPLIYCVPMPAFPLRREASAGVIDADAALVARAREGDEAAFEELVHRHEAEIYRVCRRMLGSREAALDAAQETFVRVFRALGRFRGDAAFRTWVYGIAVNVCRNLLASREFRQAERTGSLHGHGEEGGFSLEPPDSGIDPEQAAYGRELGRALHAALMAVSQGHREVIVLRDVEGLEYEEIAAALGCRLGTVKSRLARARSALLAALEGVWP